MENVLLGKKALNFILLLFSLLIFVNAQPKGYIYEESKVVNYSLPDPLICNDGKKVENKNLWDEKEGMRFFDYLRTRSMVILLNNLFVLILKLSKEKQVHLEVMLLEDKLLSK